jgi:hypothetical protein
MAHVSALSNAKGNSRLSETTFPPKLQMIAPVAATAVLDHCKSSPVFGPVRMNSIRCSVNGMGQMPHRTKTSDSKRSVGASHNVAVLATPNIFDDRKICIVTIQKEQSQ